MLIASWNVNSIRARLPHILDWLKENQPDILCLQELKCTEQDFPFLEIEELGYKANIFGQKAFNGVAFITKHNLSDISYNLPNYSDEQSRYIEASIDNKAILASIYLPNGNPLDSEKYDYKLTWMDHFIDHCQNLLKSEKPIILCGDYNIIPENQDVYDPKGWQNDALFHIKTRKKYRKLYSLGFIEAYRSLNPGTEEYTYWDYTKRSWQNNYGIRIDHFLLSPQAADLMDKCYIDKTPRAKEKASDHTPICCTFNF